MNPSLEALEKQYFFLTQSLTDLSDRGATTEELDALRRAVVQSRTNYWKAVNGALHDEDPDVASLITQMKTAQVDLEASLKNLTKVARALDVVTRAVDIGSQLAAKVIAL